MEQELKASGGRRTSATRSPSLSIRGSSRENDQYPQDQQDADRPSDTVNSFAADSSPGWRRSSTPTRSAGPGCDGWGSPRASNDLSHKPDSQDKDAQEKLTKINKWYQRATRLHGQAASRNPRAGRPRQPAGQHDDRLDPPELGKGNSHTLDNIPFVLFVGNGLDSPRWAARSRHKKVPPTTALLLAMARLHGPA